MLRMSLPSDDTGKDKRRHLVIYDSIKSYSRILTDVDISLISEHHLPHEIIARIDRCFIDDDTSD